MQTYGQPGRLARGAHAIKSAVGLAVPGPGVEAAGVEMAVAGMETATHRPGREVRNWQLHDSALEPVADLFVRHEEDAAGAVGDIEQSAFERAPTLAGDPERFTR